jgi:autotransporter-associated beta strand protein
MMHSVDRAVGDITTALTANGIDDNTIVVFLNDNGGPAASVGPYNNAPLRGNKGSLWEGGIRVPMAIKAPGLQPGVYDGPVVSRDLVPTLINAAGGIASEIDLDGADLMPFLSGEVAGDPHELMFWRSMGGRFAVRKGDWKLARPGNATFAGLYDLATNEHEDIAYNAEHPELVSELLRELAIWEATLQKPKWGAFGAARNRFDHFVFRNDVATSAAWSNPNAWNQGGTETNVTFIGEDAYANAILEFKVRDDSNYTSTNNMTRMTGQTVMLNQMRLTGTFNGTSDRSGIIDGNALLFVRNLDGLPPRIQLDATSTQATHAFKFVLDNELQLLDDLEISGNGSQEFVIDGDIRDFHNPRGVIKSGASSVTLAGSNTFSGGLQLAGGRVTTSNILGTVANNGGIFAPGPAQRLATTGDFEQSGGVLEIEIGGTVRGVEYDALRVNGDFNPGGTLRLSLVNGFVPQPNQSFSILDWTGAMTGSFLDVELPPLGEYLEWNTTELYTRGSVSISFAEVPGDMNQDNANNAADYVLWRKLAGPD